MSERVADPGPCDGSQEPARPGAWSRIGGILLGAVFVAYPFLVYLALTRLGARVAGLLVVAALVLHGLRARWFGRQGFRTLLLQAGGVALLAGATAATGHPGFLLQLPVLISVFLGITFAATLVRPPPMIERYARMVDPELTPAEVRHCRVVTWVWLAFFAVNAGIAEWLALRGDPAAWALYSGGIAYGLMGLLFAGEYVVRKARFGRFGDRAPDRVLAALLSRRRWRAIGMTLAFYVPQAINGLLFLLGWGPPLWLATRVHPRAIRVLYAYSRWFYRFQMRVLTAAGAIRIPPIEGVERLRQGGPMVVVANHRTLLDVLILMGEIPDACCLVKPIRRPAGDTERHAMPDFWKPFILWPFAMLGYVPMPADWNDRAALKATFDRCRETLAAGRPMVIFPEGTRSPTGDLLPFRDFPFRLALDAGVPVVPVFLHTQVRFMPQGRVTIDSPERCVFRIRVLPEAAAGRGTKAADLSFETRRRFMKLLAEANREHGYRE